MKYSLNDYTSRNPLNELIAENMLDLTLLQQGFDSFEMKACICFSTAYEICKQIIESSPISPWKVPDYYKKATYTYANGDLVTIMKAVTISIVLILAEHFDENWQQNNRKFLVKMKDGLKNLQLSEEKKDVFSKSILSVYGLKSACVSAYETLRRGTNIDYVIPFEEFSSQVNNTTSRSGENNITREELKKVIEETIKESFDQHKKEIDKEEESITDEEIKKAWEQALANAKAEIEEKIPRIVYDEKTEGLKIITGSDIHNNENNESLEDIIKTTLKKYLDENSSTDEDIDEIFADVYGKELVDQVNRELSEENDNEEADDLKQFNQSPTTTIDNDLQQQLDEARKTIEEQETTIKDLNETIKKYQMRKVPPAKRKGIALGLTPLQADIFGDFLANQLGINFNNKKEELSLILNCLFGDGRSSLANKMSIVSSKDTAEDRLYVASIFGPSSPNIAKKICSDWDNNTPAPWEEDKEGDEESD